MRKYDPLHPGDTYKFYNILKNINITIVKKLVRTSSKGWPKPTRLKQLSLYLEFGTECGGCNKNLFEGKICNVYGRILMLLEQLEANVRTCTIFRHGLYIMIISQICRNGKDCSQIGDRMSDNDEKLPCLH